MQMKIGVLANKNKVKNTNAVQRLMALLVENNYETLQFHTPSEIKDVDVLIVLGGDGAILHSAINAAVNGIKIIGINFGNLGFLTEYEKDELEDVLWLLSQIQAGTCRTLQRTLLQLEINGKTFYALNEISVQRYSGISPVKNTQILRLDVQTQEGNAFVAGDGALFCTPTGSTAYSLSAGGAILTPEVPVIMMTPICAFSMRSRPTVFSDNEIFRVTIQRGNGAISCDGTTIAVLSENAQITIKKAPFTANFPIRESSDFFEKVRNKLSE
jgi:NAD+ kinase